MKKMLLNSTLFACLVVGAISLWIVANPVTVYAASAWATCKNNETVTCTAAESNCIGVDSTESMSGYCKCTSQADGSITALVFCLDDVGDPPPAN